MTELTNSSRPWWRESATLVLASVLSLGLGGCEIFNDDDDDDDEMVEVGESLARFIHAVSDAPNVNVTADGAAAFENVEFKEASDFITVDARPTAIAVDAITAAGVDTVVGPVTLDLQDDTEYTVVAIGSVADATLDALVIENPTAAVTDGSVRAQVVHAASLAPTVDVYVTAPGADLTQEAPLTQFAFGEFTGQVEVPEGDYQIRATLEDDADTVVFDSGTINLPASLDLTLVAVNSTLPGAAPISLVVADASGTVMPFEILDTATPAALRVVHVSADAPAVDVVVNDDFDTPVLTDVPYTAASGFLELPVAADEMDVAINVKVTPAGNPGVIVNNDGMGDDFVLPRGSRSTVLATGLLNDNDFLLLPLTDDDRSVATDARVRIVHGSPSAGAVDIYVTEPGVDITTVDPAFPDVPFRAETGYVALPPGTYDVAVTPTGTTNVAISLTDVMIDGGGVYTVIARDAEGGGVPLGVILLDDFVAEDVE
jgi:hypothetical protein